MQNLQSLPRNLSAAESNLKKALVISFLVHLALFIIIPNYRATQDNLPKSRTIPVELVTIKPKRAIRRKKPPPPKPKPKQARGIYKAQISQHVAKLSQRSRTDFALPDISLPDNLWENLPETLIPKSSHLFSPDEFFGDMETLPANGLEKMTVDDSQPKGTRKSPLDSATGIEWKGAYRKTLHQPPLPRISSKVEGDVQIKFWVNRNGNVTQMIPVRKLDAGVESMAMSYIKKWRFEPLPRGKDYLQWGIITLKIRLK